MINPYVSILNSILILVPLKKVVFHESNPTTERGLKGTDVTVKCHFINEAYLKLRSQSLIISRFKIKNILPEADETDYVQTFSVFCKQNHFSSD